MSEPKESNAVHADWLDQRNRQILDAAIERGLVVFALAALPLPLIDIGAGLVYGWRPLYGVHIAWLALVFIAVWQRARISVALKARLIVLACIGMALSGLYSNGVAAVGPAWFLSMAIFWAGMLYTRRTQGLIVALLLSSIAAIAAAHISGIVQAKYDTALFVLNPATWLYFVFAACIYIAMVLPTVVAYQKAMNDLLAETTRQRDEIAYLAEHDPLTGLPRLRLARDRLDMACQRARRSGGQAALMFIDLDGFKELNDNHGHAAGDQCLIQVAERIRKQLRGEDTAARIGGDEFIVILDELSDRQGAAVFAQRLIAAVTQPIPFQHTVLRIGASIGIALCPGHGTDARSLQHSADQAMYRVKRSGKNNFAFGDPPAATAAIETAV